MRKFFEKFGCVECFEAKKAINKFNATRPPEGRIEIESIGGSRFLRKWPDDYSYQFLAENIWQDEEVIKIPFLIFDGIVVRKLDDAIGYYAMLEELDGEMEI